MAYNNNASSNNAAKESWKADAFLNPYIRKADGTRVKVGKTGVSLSLSRKWDKAFIERMQLEGAADALKGVLEFDFQLVTDTPVEQDALGF